MNVPKGNAVALQALKPIENKTADILSGYVFELIKQGNAEKAAKLKALEDRGAAVDEIVSKMDLKIDSTLPQFQEGLNKYGKSAFDIKYEAEKLRGDNSPEAIAKRERLVLEYNKIKSNYELAKSFYANPEINAKIKETQKAIAENKLYKGGKSYSSFLAVMGAPSVAGEENGNFGLYHYEQGADKSIKDNKTVFTQVGDLYNNILGLEEDTSSTTWTELDTLNATTSTKTDTGFVSRETVKLKEQAVRKSVRDLLGVDNTKPLDEQFESVSELPKKTKHLYYDLYKKEPQSKEDFKGFEDKILNRIKAKTNESDKVDRARPTVVNVNNGSGGGNGSGENEPIISSSVLKLYNADKSGKKDTRFYNADGVMMKGSAKYNEFGPMGNQKSREVFVQAYWNPNGKNANGGKGSIAYGLAIPVKGGSFVTRPLSSKEDPSGAKSVQKYFTNAEFSKFNNKTREYFSNPENRNGYKFNPNVDKTLYGDETLFTDLLPSLGNTVRQSNRTQQ